MDWIANDNQTIPPDSSADYKYAAGLDYLNGHDSAVRHKKAVALIQEAANEGHEEAMNTMVRLHRRNVGLGLTFMGEIDWLEKLTDMAESRYFTEFHREFGDTCCRYMEQLYLAHIAYAQIEEAQSIAERWHHLAADMQERYFTVIPLATAELRLSDLFFYLGKQEMALMYCRNVYERTQPLCQSNPVPQHPAMLAYAAADRMNRLMFLAGKAPDSKLWEETLLTLEEKIIKGQDLESLRNDWLLSTLQLSFPMRSAAEDRKALWLEQIPHYRAAVSALEKYARCSPIPSVKEMLAEKYMEIANVFKEIGNASEAIECYRKAHGQWKALFDKRPGAEYQYLMARCLRLQIPTLLQQYLPMEAERQAYLACSLAVQLRDPELTSRAKTLLSTNYRDIYKHYFDRLLLDYADRITCKIGILERELKNGDGASLVYLRHLSNLSKKAKDEAENKRYAFAILCCHCAILFADHYRRNLPFITSSKGQSVKIIISSTVVQMYQCLGEIELALGNRNASREYRRMARYIRKQP